MSSYLFTPLIQRVTICSCFWLDATSRLNGSMLRDRLKQNQTKNPWIKFETVYDITYLLGIWYLERRKYSRPFISGYPWIQSKDGKYLKKKFHEIPKNKTWICHPSSTTLYLSFPGGSDSKESACNVADTSSIHGSGRSPEKEMATHSSILAWRIPGTEEPCRQQSMGSQRVGCD